jgi:hypothetical protein
MKRTVLIAMVLVLLFLAAGLAYAQATDYTLPWWTTNGGGGNSTGGNYSLTGTIAQPDVGAMAGGNYRMEGGFWGGGLSGGTQVVYLPLIRR